LWLRETDKELTQDALSIKSYKIQKMTGGKSQKHPARDWGGSHWCLSISYHNC